jgi:hypothetical protein plarl_12301
MDTNIYKNIQTLCNEKNLTIAEVERKADISNGSIRRWSDSYPSIDKVARVAEVLNTTLEFIFFGKIKNVPSTITRKLESLDESDTKSILNMVDFLLSKK